jgi:hypothetical protein
MELILDEGRVSGARYYTVKPTFDAHIQPWFNQEWNEMLEWCVDTYGATPKEGVWTPNSRWYANNSKFWFREQKDLEWFILKWQ